MVEITLTGRVPSKKNSRVTDTRTGRTFPSELYRRWHLSAMSQLMIAGVKKDLLDNVMISIAFSFGDKRKCDLTNKAESIMDLLVDYGAIKDDSWQTVYSVYMDGWYEYNNWKTKIVITERDYETKSNF